MNKKNNTPEMKIVREKIDALDDKLLPLMVKRSFLVEKALELKNKRSEIVDRKRINQIQMKIKNKTKVLGGNPKLLSKIWISIINNFIEFEKRKFKKKNFMCVNCNSPAKLKNNSVVIEIDSPESDPVDRAIEHQLIIAQQRNQPRTIGEIYCPQCPEIQSICCIWVFVLFVLLIIVL